MIALLGALAPETTTGVFTSEEWFQMADDAAEHGFMHTADLYWEHGVVAADREEQDNA